MIKSYIKAKAISSLEDELQAFFDIRTLNGAKVNKGSISYKKLRIQDTANAYLKEIKAIPHMNKFTCVLA